MEERYGMKFEDNETMWVVNGQIVYAKEFAFDGCHKIYVMDDQVQKKKFEKYGYEFFPIDDLQKAYEDSCGLRFISHADVEEKEFVGQGVDAVFQKYQFKDWHEVHGRLPK